MKAMMALVVVIFVIIVGAGIYYFYLAAEEKAKIEQEAKAKAELEAKAKAELAAKENKVQPVDAKVKNAKETVATADTAVAAPVKAELTPERDTRPTLPRKSTAASNVKPSTSRISATLKVDPSKKTNPKNALEGPNKKTGSLRDDIPLKKADPAPTSITD